MNKKVKIITDSCCSLSQEKLKEMGVDYVQMSIVVNDEAYDSFSYPTKNKKEFYTSIKRSTCSTSCVNSQTFRDIFEKYIKEGYDVFYVGLSSGLSCTYNNAITVGEELNKIYGESVYVADSLTGSYGIALMVEKAVEMANAGKSAKEIFKAIDKNAMKLFSIFIPSDLQFLMRSGRIGAFAAGIGTILKLVPIIMADEKGKLKTIQKCLGQKKAMKSIQDYFLTHANLESAETIYIGHTGQEEIAQDLATFIKQQTKNKNIVVDYIDYTMGCWIPMSVF